jgi:hypothetical protein
LKDKIEINQFKKEKKSELALSFETSDSGHELKTNLMEGKS